MNNWLVGRDLGFSFLRQLKEFYQWLVLLLFALLPAGALLYFRTEALLGGGAGAKWVVTTVSVLLYLLLYVGLSYLLSPSIRLLFVKTLFLTKQKFNLK